MPNSGRIPVVTCYVDTDMVNASYALTGLIELANAGEIVLRFRLGPRRLVSICNPFVMWMEVRGGDYGQRQKVALDFHDVSTFYCPVSLAQCDAYFKTNFSSKTIESVAPQHAGKLRPFGPFMPCRPLQDRYIPLRAIGNWLGHTYFHFFSSSGIRKLTRRVRVSASHAFRYRRYLNRGILSDLETPPQEVVVGPDKPLVFFHGTCWNLDLDPTGHVSAFRAEVIRKLRAHLGPRFRGGFRRDAFAEKHYPEAVEDQPYSYKEYLHHLHTAPIAFYTNGLSGCFSWRFIELFAASRCVVSERIVNDPGFALDPSSGILQFNSPDEVVKAIVELADDPHTISEMQHRTWQAYQTWMRPDRRMHRLLTELPCNVSASAVE